MISNCILVVSWLAAAHLDLCTEAIALLFQRIHFSFLSCHGDGCSGMLLTGNETLKREGDKQRERKQSVRCWSLGTARMNNSRSELFTRWEHLSSRSSSIIQSINKSERLLQEFYCLHCLLLSGSVQVHDRSSDQAARHSLTRIRWSGSTWVAVTTSSLQRRLDAYLTSLIPAWSCNTGRSNTGAEKMFRVWRDGRKE